MNLCILKFANDWNMYSFFFTGTEIEIRIKKEYRLVQITKLIIAENTSKDTKLIFGYTYTLFMFLFTEYHWNNWCLSYM